MLYYWYVNNRTEEEFLIQAETREESEEILDEYFENGYFMYCGSLRHDNITKAGDIKILNA